MEYLDNFDSFNESQICRHFDVFCAYSLCVNDECRRETMADEQK